MIINEKFYFINNKINNYILNIYLIKLNSLNNIVINSYFQLVSFKWLLIGYNASLGAGLKTKKLHSIFFKRLNFSTFINKNIIISEDKSNKSVAGLKMDIKKNNNNQRKKLNKNLKNKIKILNRSEEKLLLYSRFSLLYKQYANASKNKFSILIFKPQQKILYNNFKKYIKLKICFFSNFNNLSLLQKELFFIKKFSLDKLKLKKIIMEPGVISLKNFLNLKKKK